MNTLKDPGGGLVVPASKDSLDFSVIADRLAGETGFTDAVQSIVLDGDYTQLRSLVLLSLLEVLQEQSDEDWRLVDLAKLDLEGVFHD